MHLSKPDIDRLSILRNEGGRGMIQLELSVNSYGSPRIKRHWGLDGFTCKDLKLKTTHHALINKKGLKKHAIAMTKTALGKKTSSWSISYVSGYVRQGWRPIFLIAAQDQSLFTRNCLANVLKNGTRPKCRFRDKLVETTDHLVSGYFIESYKI